MCGIIAVAGATIESSSLKSSKKSDKNSQKLIGEIILNGLKKLEYRGYDSAGIAFLEDKKFLVIKEEGKIAKLENSLKKRKFKATTAIGHTRWATHGKPSKENAHPHLSKNFAVVHNGIIENYQQLKEKLLKSGSKFLSKTDSEVLPHLLEMHFAIEKDLKLAMQKMMAEIRGTFAIAAIFREKNDLLILAKRGSPLIIGVGENANYAASDFYGLSDQTNKIIALDDNEIALVGKNSVEIFNQTGEKIEKKINAMEASSAKVDKGNFAHFMLKEIYEQPRIIEETLQTYFEAGTNKIILPNFSFDLAKINKITIVACGTSYYAGLASKYILEHISGIEVEVDIASEFRYRAHPFRADNLMIFISQSGETADSIASLKFAKQNQQKILSVVNVAHSTMAQLSDSVIRTIAGPEIGVASTKAYTAQILVMSLFAIELGRLRNKILPQEQIKLIGSIASCQAKMLKIFEEDSIKNIKKVAYKLSKKRQILYVGRSVSQITAFEAALKFRELTYINASGIAAGELKHGTIALIDKKMPVIVIAPHNRSNDLFEKTVSNAEEINARGGKIIFVSDKKGIQHFGKMARNKIEIPEIENLIEEALLPIVSMQILAYYATVFKDFDVDQPRNLAKSVTVE